MPKAPARPRAKSQTPSRPAALRFDVHPAVEKMQDWIRSLESRTGRSLDDWMNLIKAAARTNQGPKDAVAARAWLKAEFDPGTNTAWWLAERAYAQDLSLMDDDPKRYMALAPKYVAAQYAGKKAALQPIFARLYALARGRGKDVKVCPCETIVPLYRKHVFGQIKPTTNTRVDLGLCLTPLLKVAKPPKLPPRLIDTGGFKKKDRITHRIALETVNDIDAFVETWMQKAYELDA